MELGIVITIAVGVIVAIFQDQLKSLGHRIADLARKTASGRHSDSPSVGPVSKRLRSMSGVQQTSTTRAATAMVCAKALRSFNMPSQR